MQGHAHTFIFNGRWPHQHDVRVILVVDDVHRILSAVHDCCLNFLLGECLQHITDDVTLKLTNSNAALKLRTAHVSLHIGHNRH